MTLPRDEYLAQKRNFTIPHDIFSISVRKAKPKGWHILNKNRFIGDAKTHWKNKEEDTSACDCKPPQDFEQQLGCGDFCVNRAMQYECNAANCRLPPKMCGNRPFANLAARLKKGGAYNVGVEIIETANRGYGVRACRSFAAGEIVMEYTGEIITEYECQRRIREDYSYAECFYIMGLAHGLLIDGMKGNVGRFINHSCQPNCEVRMLTVDGKLRLGVFAGEDGVPAGTELTYDYNYETCAGPPLKCHCGTPSCRGFLTKRRNVIELKKEAAAKRKAEQEVVQTPAKKPRSNAVKRSTTAVKTIKPSTIIEETATANSTANLPRDPQEGPSSSNRKRKAGSQDGPPKKVLKPTTQPRTLRRVARKQYQAVTVNQTTITTTHQICDTATAAVQASNSIMTTQDQHVQMEKLAVRVSKSAKTTLLAQKASGSASTVTNGETAVVSAVVAESSVRSRPTRVRKMPQRMLMLLGE